jgi:predicted GH43/DUF377 family glycosyl hydrolase
LADAAPFHYIIHSTDHDRFPLPDTLYEGQTFPIGGDGISDVAFYAHKEPWFRILYGNAAYIDDNGRVILLYKAVCKNGTIRGGRVRLGVAFSDSPSGPFERLGKPIFEVQNGEDEWMVAEDPFVWFQKGIWYAIVRDVVGKFTGDKGAFALMVSRNGFDWEPAKHPKVIGSKFLWECFLT